MDKAKNILIVNKGTNLATYTESTFDIKQRLDVFEIGDEISAKKFLALEKRQKETGVRIFVHNNVSRFHLSMLSNIDINWSIFYETD